MDDTSTALLPRPVRMGERLANEPIRGGLCDRRKSHESKIRVNPETS
jgi:hypothetical protein